MEKTIKAEGICLCGAVKMHAEAVIPKAHACHCGMCCKWGGGPLMAVDCGQAVRFEGEENISVYVSSSWAERGFCRACGTHLFYRTRDSQQYFVPVDVFDGLDGVTLDGQLFIDRKPAYYTLANQTAHNLTEAEVFAMFAGDAASP